MLKNSTYHLPLLIAALTLPLAALLPISEPAKAADKETPDWPCIQRKVENLTPIQMWDGPSIEDIKGWWSDKDVQALINKLASRRTSTEEAEKAIKEFAEAQPEDKRDERLTLVFAGLFDKVNTSRRGIISGIEKYQRAQAERAETIEKMGSEIYDLEQKIDKNPDDEAMKAELKKKRDDHEWASRIFQEKQRNFPLACEIPVMIDQHIFQMAQLIRQNMSE